MAKQTVTFRPPRTDHTLAATDDLTITSDEPLVMIRVGTPNHKKQPEPTRIGRDGKELRGDSKENKTVPVIFKEGALFGG